MAKVLVKNASNIYTIYFKGKGITPFQVGEGVTGFTKTGLIDMSWLNVEYYDGMAGNHHHITTRSYYDIILPYLSLYIKDFPYNKDDFKIVPYWSDDKLYSVAYLKPKKNMKFTISINNIVLSEHGNFDSITNAKKIWEENAGCVETAYHRLFRGAHTCGKVINETIDNDKKLFISCDSMAIPMLPIFACYYKEVVFMDNRTSGKTSYANYFENVVFDDVIFCVSCHAKLDKFTDTNLT